VAFLPMVIMRLPKYAPFRAMVSYAIAPKGGLLVERLARAAFAATRSRLCQLRTAGAASGRCGAAEARRARGRREGPAGRRSATIANCAAAPGTPGFSAAWTPVGAAKDKLVMERFGMARGAWGYSPGAMGRYSLAMNRSPSMPA